MNQISSLIPHATCSTTLHVLRIIAPPVRRVPNGERRIGR